jgi:hypothetical protein
MASECPEAGQQREQSARPIIGYLRMAGHMPERHVERMQQRLADYAGREGFCLTRTLVERDPMRATAFDELIRALQAGEAEHAVVPALHHFAHFTGMQLAMKELLERHTGASLLVMYQLAGEPT